MKKIKSILLVCLLLFSTFAFSKINNVSADAITDDDLVDVIPWQLAWQNNSRIDLGHSYLLIAANTTSFLTFNAEPSGGNKEAYAVKFTCTMNITTPSYSAASGIYLQLNQLCGLEIIKHPDNPNQFDVRPVLNNHAIGSSLGEIPAYVNYELEYIVIFNNTYNNPYPAWWIQAKFFSFGQLGNDSAIVYETSAGYSSVANEIQGNLNIISADDYFWAGNIWNAKIYTGVSIVLSADLENIDDNGADWVFTDWRYYTFKIEIPIYYAGVGVFTNVSLNFLASVGEMDFQAYFICDNGVFWGYNDTLQRETRFGKPILLRSGVWSLNTTYLAVTFPIFFKGELLDVWLSGVDVYAYINSSDISMEQPFFKVASNFFRIYSQGGFTMDFSTTDYGYANRIVGGSPFSFYAYSGETVTNYIWYRDLQHIKLLPEITCYTGKDVFDVSFGVDYSFGNGSWETGWKAIIIPNTVAYPNLLNGQVWINYTVNFYNRIGWVSSNNYIYAFYHGSVAQVGDIIRSRLWLDAWFDSENASSVGGIRVNAYEFPMKDNADSWLLQITTNSWGVKDDVEKEANCLVPILGENDVSLASAMNVKMVRFWMSLDVANVTDSQYVMLNNYDVFDKTFSKQFPLSGVQKPVFDETKTPTVGQTPFLGALFSLFSKGSQWVSENVMFGGLNMWGNFVNFLDTIASWLGAPKLFSNLLVWIGQLWIYVEQSVTFVLQIFINVFLLMNSLLTVFMTTIGSLIVSLTNTVTFFTSFMSGSYGVGVDLWTQFNISQWLTLILILYPLYLVFLWDQKGMGAVFEQLGWIFGLLSWLANFFFTIIQLGISFISGLIESVPVVE